MKGLFAGLIVFLVALTAGFVAGRPLEIVSWALIYAAVASFYVMNFTGASTYTSLSGVKKEMRVAVPLQIAAAAVGFVLWIVARFL